jgi:predicted 3-demethylubiquinone-9 3-methyltransferase (glyoxalase superfamily)
MPKITPFLWFDGKIDQAVKFYRSVFKDAKVLNVTGSGKNVMSATVKLDGQELILFNGGPHYKLTPAMSLFVHCRTQKEIDYYWTKLLKGGEESRCGWLTDQFGVSWQIVPTILVDLIGDKNRAKADRAMQAMLGMKKLDIQTLKNAHAGK